MEQFGQFGQVAQAEQACAGWVVAEKPLPSICSCFQWLKAASPSFHCNLCSLCLIFLSQIHNFMLAFLLLAHFLPYPLHQSLVLSLL